MAVEFKFSEGKDFRFTTAFAERFNVETGNDQVSLPASLGIGMIKDRRLTSGLTLSMHCYELREHLTLKRMASSYQDALTIKFDSRRGINGYSVEIGTSNMFTEVTLPPYQNINFMVIIVTRENLLQLLQLGEEGKSLADFMANTSFILYESMTQEMERIVNQISLISDTTKLADLFYRIKAQELIYQLFTKLLTRPVHPSIPIHQADAEKIYELRASILADISSVPQLPELALKTGMSLTKMKQLFRQIFGDSIYNYYQKARMNEAARLLAHFSVSETGYKIGFTNLSHFTRLFERHYQMKPKRYKDTLNIE